MSHDPERPFQMIVAFPPTFKIRLTGKELREANLDVLIKAELPVIDHNTELHLLCAPYTTIKSQTVPDEMPSKS